MRSRLPPLNGLRAFETAARHLSFAKAAAELSVTAGAVSHQVKLLEAYLGVQLFQRQPHGIRLTAAGQDALPMLQDAFDRLGLVADRLESHRSAGTLVVSVAPTFAAKWLVPRIEAFHAQHPQIDVRIDAAKRVVDFSREDVDVAIRFGNGEATGLRVWPLFDGRDAIFPVCAPDLPAAAGPLRRPADLAHHVLLHAEWKSGGSPWPNWRAWLDAADAPDIDAARGPSFTTWVMAIQAARAGHGVALGSRILVAEELAAGTLIRPFDIELAAPENLGFYIVCPEAAATRPKVTAFRDWLLATSRREKLFA